MLKNSEFYETLVDGIGEGINKPKPKADFDENDPKNPGYIKNRTHWKEEIPEKNVVIADIPERSYSGTGFGIVYDSPKPIIEGKTYTIEVSNSSTGDYSYEAIAYAGGEDGNDLCLSARLVSSNSFEGVFVFQDNKIRYTGSPTSYYAKVKITYNEPAHTIYHPIDANYLPQNLISEDELFCRVDVFDTSGGNYRCNPDFNTIYNWCESGKNVYCSCNAQGYGILPLDSYSDSKIIFEGDTAYFGEISRRTIEINSDGTANVSQMSFAYLPGISNTPKSISAGQTIVAKHIQYGVNLVDQWEAADIVRPSTIGDLSDLTTESKGNLVAAINEVKAGGGSGGASVQSDWNQNDETAADYVKNRTHWAEFGQVRRYLAKDATIEFEGGGSWKIDDAFRYSYPSDISLEAGQQVNFRIGSGMYAATLTSDTATNLRAAISGINPTAFVFDTANHTVSAYGMGGGPYGFDIFVETEGITGYHPLDENYLPDSVKNYYVKITQDDNGNVTSDKTPAEIAAAYEAGYSVYAEYRDMDRTGILSLSAAGGLHTLFTGTVAALGIPLRALVMCVNGAWNAQFSPLDNVVTELSNTSTDNEVPSAKCVYDTMIQGLRYAFPISRQLGISDAKAGQLAKIKAVNENGNPISWEAVDMPSGTDLSLGLTSASVGQIIKVKAVDENGKPTEWETAEMAGGDKWELIKHILVPEGAEEANALTINTDENGNAFSLKKARLTSMFPPYTGESTIPNYSFTMINGVTGGSQSPLSYTSGLPLLDKGTKLTSLGWLEADLSMPGYQVERVGRFAGSGGRPSETMYWGARRLNGAETITSIGGTSMLIYHGCEFYLYGVRA